MDKKGWSHWFILVILGLIGVFSILLANNQRMIAVLMGLAYISNASYSMVSRSAVRDSALYHAFTTLLSNFVFYLVLYILITDQLTLALFIPYTVATVYGSFTGAKASQKVEEFFGITTDPTKKKSTPQSVLAQKILLIFLAVMGIVVGIYAKSIFVALTIAGLSFADNITFSILRRSRNTSNSTYHVAASILKSTAVYLMLGTLSLKGMPFDLFMPYCFGSILGGITGQKISAWVERKIGATADAHLFTDASWYQFIPWKWVIVLAIITIPLLAFSSNYLFLAYLAALSAAQQVSFSIVSRSRQRNNMAYHVIASIFSNSVWFLTFRQLNLKNWTNELYAPYALGGAIGSVTGAGVSMGIEKKLGISSDSHVMKTGKS